MIEAAQVRAARALIGWSTAELANAAGLHVAVIELIEGGGDKVPAEDIAKMRAALEAAGVTFIPENGGGAGVRLRKGREAEYIDLEQPQRVKRRVRCYARSTRVDPLSRVRAPPRRAWRGHACGASSTKPPCGAGCGTFQPK
jgi:transcriptional regulator with XRE-family HTH domain